MPEPLEYRTPEAEVERARGRFRDYPLWLLVLLVVALAWGFSVIIPELSRGPRAIPAQQLPAVPASQPARDAPHG